MTDTLNLHVLPGRCDHGFHLKLQGCSDCGLELKDRAITAVNESAAPDFAARIDAAIRSAAAHEFEWSPWTLRWGCSCGEWTAHSAYSRDEAATRYREHLGAKLIEGKA